MKHTDATKAKLSEIRRGERNPMYGRKHSPETRAKLAANLRIIIDGEGSLRFAKGRPFLAVYNGSTALMQRLVEDVGGSYRAADHRGRTVNYCWRIAGALDLLALCRALYPYLTVKREDCAAVISHLEAKYG